MQEDLEDEEDDEEADSSESFDEDAEILLRQQLLYYCDPLLAINRCWILGFGRELSVPFRQGVLLQGLLTV